MNEELPDIDDICWYYGQYSDNLTDKMKINGVGFEVNTSTWRKGMKNPMPSIELISALVKNGVTTISVGSDAHRPKDVGSGIDRALTLLAENGFPYRIAPTTRQRNRIR